MDRGRVAFQGVAHEQIHRLAFTPAQDRCRQRSIDGDRRTGAASEVGQRFADGQFDAGVAEHGGGAGQAWGGSGGGERARHADSGDAGNHATGGQALHEQAARRHGHSARTAGMRVFMVVTPDT